MLQIGYPYATTIISQYHLLCGIIHDNITEFSTIISLGPKTPGIWTVFQNIDSGTTTIHKIKIATTFVEKQVVASYIRKALSYF